MYQLKPKAYYRRLFDGSDRLFDYCWKQYRALLRSDIDNPRDDSDVVGWLTDLASHSVNSSRSSFYIYGR